MKKAIKIFAVILILSAISTICFLAAAGTELIEYIIDYASRHRIESFGEFDDFDNVLKDYVIEKYGEITNSDGTVSFLPNANIFLAALLVLVLLAAVLLPQQKRNSFNLWIISHIF